MVSIEAARFPEDVETVRTLFREYQRTPDVSECVAGFEQELAGLPGRYTMVLLGLLNGAACGVAALRPLDERTCEMKRLFVQAGARGSGLGCALVKSLISAAREQGFQTMKLDTLPSMTAAQALYRRLGFRPVERYYAAAPQDALFFELELHD